MLECFNLSLLGSDNIDWICSCHWHIDSCVILHFFLRRISDEILAECVYDVGKELDDINNDIINHVYQSEFTGLPGGTAEPPSGESQDQHETESTWEGRLNYSNYSDYVTLYYIVLHVSMYRVNWSLCANNNFQTSIIKFSLHFSTSRGMVWIVCYITYL